MIDEVLKEISNLRNERMKKIYLSNGIKEPVYGIPTKDLKPLSKKYKNNYELALELFNTNIYEAMYLACWITDIKKMTKSNFEDWINKSYCRFIGDYSVAVTLAESPLVFEIANIWINSDNDIKASAGWYAITWHLGVKKDNEIDLELMEELLRQASKEVYNSKGIVLDAISQFIMTLGISYLPLHEKAYILAKEISKLDENYAYNEISKFSEKNRLGFKRKNVRC